MQFPIETPVCGAPQVRPIKAIGCWVRVLTLALVRGGLYMPFANIPGWRSRIPLFDRFAPQAQPCDDFACRWVRVPRSDRLHAQWKRSLFALDFVAVRLPTGKRLIACPPACFDSHVSFYVRFPDPRAFRCLQSIPYTVSTFSTAPCNITPAAYSKYNQFVQTETQAAGGDRRTTCLIRVALIRRGNRETCVYVTTAPPGLFATRSPNYTHSGLMIPDSIYSFSYIFAQTVHRSLQAGAMGNGQWAADMTRRSSSIARVAISGICSAGTGCLAKQSYLVNWSGRRAWPSWSHTCSPFHRGFWPVVLFCILEMDNINGVVLSGSVFSNVHVHNIYI